METTVAWNGNNAERGAIRDAAPTGRGEQPEVQRNNDRDKDAARRMSMPNGDPPSLVLWGEGANE